MLINTCIVLQSSLCSNCLFGRKDSSFLTFIEGLTEKNFSCWLCVGDISRVFVIKLWAFVRRYHTVTGFAVLPTGECWFPRGAQCRTRTCDVEREAFGFSCPFNGSHCWFWEIRIILVHIVTSCASSLSQQGCLINGWLCGRALDWNSQGFRFDYPKASLCDLGQMP